MRRSTFAFLMLMPLGSGCDEARTFVPTAPTAAPVPNTGIAVMRGAVLDTAMRPISGAFVEVLDGPSAHATANAMDYGLVTLTGTFERTTRFRASAEGHESLVLTCPEPCNAFNQTMWINFYLRPLAPPAIDLAGNYTLTVTLSGSCATLSAEPRTRAYQVSLTPRTRPGTADLMGYFLTFHSDAVVDWLRRGYIGVAGNDVRSYWTSGEGDQPGVIEALGDNRYLTIMGIAEAALNPGASPVMLTLNGSIAYLTVSSPLTSTGGGGAILSQEQCTARDHRVVLTSR